MKTSPISIAIAAFAALTVVSAPAALAQDIVTVEVEYSPQELLTPQGVESVVERIQYKARKACGHTHGRMPITEAVAVRQCTQSAIEDAITKVKRPQLAQALREAQG